MQGERRRYPRVSTQLEVEVRTDGGDTIAGTISDLSSTGLQVLCPPEQARRIDTRGQQIAVQVHFSVTLAETEDGSVHAPCKVVFARRVSADAYCIGLSFLDLDDDSFAYLARYLESRLN